MKWQTVNGVAQRKLRIVLIAKDIELRIVSLIVRAREGADEVVLLDLGSSDSTAEYAGKLKISKVSQ